MTAFGAPQRLYRGRAICTHIPSVCGTAHPQVVAFNREVQSPNEPRTSSREALSGLSSGLGQLLRTRQEEPWLWAGEEQRAGERLGTLPALEHPPPPLVPAPAHSHGQDPAAENSRKVLPDENPFFSDEFAICRGRQTVSDLLVEPAVGMRYLVFAAVSQKGACSLMANALHGGCSRSWFFFHACINPLVLFAFLATERATDASLSCNMLATNLQ